MVIGDEADPKTSCSECGAPLETTVCRSNAGYFLGTECDRCGPEGRESDYFATHQAAEAELALWQETGVKPHARTPGYWGGSS